MISLYKNLKELGPKMIQYKLARVGLIKTPSPIILTYSVTSACQSLCKSCNIGKVYRENPKSIDQDLRLDEVEKTFKTIGHVYFFNISGGEPFLRKDLPQIVDLACKYLTPVVMHSPTNALSPKIIEEKTREILEVMKRNNHGKTPFTIKPSFDGVGEKHDEIRGVKGNFKKLLETIERLKGLQREYPNLDVGLGTVISKFNYQDIEEIMAYVKSLNVDSYINEIAENRSEYFNLEDDITPAPEIYKKIITYFSKEIQKDIKSKKRLTRLTQAFRLVYYELVSEMFAKSKQIIPDYSGIANAHISSNGQIGLIVL
jgi:MoaA/NifB/PqqE/SkfB family radical SAM enzyme